jgi:hypothetical protein
MQESKKEELGIKKAGNRTARQEGCSASAFHPEGILYPFPFSFLLRGSREPQ